VTVRTDAEGRYEFAEVFAEGGYQLTATDPQTGHTNRSHISVRFNQDAIADLRLRGHGALRVRVVDGGGNPVSGGQLKVDGTDYPNARRFSELAPDASGVVEFANLPEGNYAVYATQNGLDGRVSATLALDSAVEVTVQLLASGTVQGKVFMPGGTAPVGLADVQLRIGGRSLGFTTTDDTDAGRGSFNFIGVPAGDFTLDVLDNRTGRAGRALGRVAQQGEVVTLNVELLPIGRVSGRVTANGQPVDHALVEIYADGSGIRGTRLQATTDADGRYAFTGIPVGRFNLSVTNAPGGQTGSASGVISGSVEPLPDTVVDIALEPSAAITGTVARPGGAPVPGARVTLTVGSRRFEAATNTSGVYRIGWVPLGEVRVRAEAPSGFDRGEAAPVQVTQPGSTVTADVTMAGTGSVAGDVLDSNGARITTGTITFTNDAWGGSPLVLLAPVQPDGRYEIVGAPAGPFTLKLTVPNRVGVGTASGTIVADQIADVTVRIEDAGSVVGLVVSPDGVTPARGADVTLTLTRPGKPTLRFFATTNAQGVWRFDNVPLGALSVAVSDVVSNGTGRADGLSLAANGATADFGTILLDNTAITVTSVTPADGAANVATNAAVTVTFSEPASAASVNAGTVRLLQGASGVGASLALSADRRAVTLTPSARLKDKAAFTVLVTTGVEDPTGHRLPTEFRSTFTTVDETAPFVTAISPATGALQVPVETEIAVTFDEALDRAQNLDAVVAVTTGGATPEPVAGTRTLDESGRVLTFRASGGLAESRRYTVTVTGQRDAAGNAQAAAASSTFTTLDRTAPVVDPLPIDGTSVRTFRPVITATYHDDATGIKTDTVVLVVDGQNVTAQAVVTGSGLSYQPATPLARGSHSVSVRVGDQAGNTSEARTAAFQIDDSGPIVSAFTIGGAAAADGMFVTSSLRPVFSVTYADDTGVNASSTKLLLGANGAAPQEVPAVVTQTGLSYQPAAPLAEGAYTVEAVVVNNLGSSTTTGRIGFTLDVDAPEITAVTPPSGSQHGGTVVTLTGSRLLTGASNSESGTGLTAEYYDNMDFTGAKVTRTDATVDFEWGSGSPDPSIGADQFSARWTGQVRPEFSETYTFSILSDDGVRLWIDDQLIIENWTVHAPTENSATVTLQAGRKHNIRLDFFENAQGAVARLYWASPSRPKEVIPQSRLYASGTAPEVFVGGVPALVRSATAGAPDTIVISTPPGAPGAADIEVRTDRGRGVLKNGFNYEADPRTPFAVEPDTAVLWHLDEPGNGAVTVRDSAGALPGTAGAASLEQAGRFGGGRARANISSINDIDGVLNFGTSSFTAEAWVKTAPVARTYTLVGKDHPTEGSFSNSWANFSLQLLPSGALRGIAFDTSNRRWQADMAPTAFDVDDDRWHLLSMVVDRAAGRMVIYADGVERASAPMPAGFTSLISSFPLRAGHVDVSGPSTGGGPNEFPGALDEIRVSTSAHSAEKVRDTYLGTEGTLGLVVVKAMPTLLPRGTTVEVRLTGYNLSGVQATVLDAAGVQQTTRVLSSSANAASFEVVVGPLAALGEAQLLLSSSAGSVTRTATVVELGQSVYDDEPDTRLLWHLDEPGNGAVRVLDASRLSIDGTAGASSQTRPGRFGGGRAYANLTADSDYNSLDFGQGSFTVEAWVKTEPVARTYTLVGKDHPTEGSFSNSWANFSLQLLPSGALRGIAFDTSNRRWQAQMPPLGFDVDDNQWHAVAMVVDREAGRMVIYVDGAERASAPMPAGFTTLINSFPFRAGHVDVSGPSIGSGPNEFPGALDEIRVSASARTAERIRGDYVGVSGLRITSYAPNVAKRDEGAAAPPVTLVDVAGYDLNQVAARVERGGQPLGVAASVVETSYRHARVALTVPANVTLGPAQLVLSKQGHPDAVADIYVSEHSEFSADVDTVVLWHLNEPGNGAARLVDGGPLSIDGTASSASTATEGHFGGGRARINAVADSDYGALDFGTRSFTAEAWVKTAPVARTYTLVGKDHPTEGSFSNSWANFSLQLLPSGALRGIAFDTSNRRWQADMAPTAFDVDDDRWHLLSMVVDRAAGRMVLYADGVERASAAMPAGFTSLINSFPLRAGHVDQSGPSAGTGPTEFPGALDEIRVSSTAHSAERVFRDAIGHDEVRLSWIQPNALQRGTSDNALTLVGNGLLNATVTANRPEVVVSVVSSSPTQINALVSVPENSALGPVRLTVTEPGGQSVTGDIHVVDQKPFVNGPEDNNTVLLWHLDETGQGGVHVVGSGDAVPSVLAGTAGGASAPAPGRFSGGRTRANIAGNNDSLNYNFGTSSFTVETWVKTAPVARTYTLVGKDHPTEGSFSNSWANFSLQLLPSGALRGIAFDTSNRRWQAEVSKAYVPGTGQWMVTIDDDRWHAVAMVVDREAGRMVMYVDGVERGSATMPAGFGALINSFPIRAGHVDQSGPSAGSGPNEFPGALDEIRIVKYAQTAAQIQDTWFGTMTAAGASALAQKTDAPAASALSDSTRPQAPSPEVARKGAPAAHEVRVHSAAPREVLRDRGAREPRVTQLLLEGSGLEGVEARLTRDGRPLDVAVKVSESSETRALLEVGVGPAVPLGGAQLEVSGAGRGGASVPVIIAERSEFAVEPDTALLWRLDEREAGAARILDAGPHGIEGEANQTSLAAEGAFAGGRSLARLTAELKGPTPDFGAAGLTVEGWVRTEPLKRAYALLGKETRDGQNTEFAFTMLPDGGLRAQLYDARGVLWQAQAPGHLARLDDGKWHSLAMSADRAAGLLTLYVDGRALAAAGMPEGFGPLRNLGQPLHAGGYDADELVTGGTEEFPGTLDEIRVSLTAHTAEKIAADFNGRGVPHVTLVAPPALPRGASALPVTLFGYGLDGATVAAARGDVGVSVVSASRTRVELLLSVPEGVAAGPLRLDVTDPQGQRAPFVLNVVERASLTKGTKGDGRLPSIGVGRVEPRPHAARPANPASVSALGRHAPVRERAAGGRR
jgi:hypothetical protein